MEKPYELKALGEAIQVEAKKEGLALAEGAVESLAKAAYNGLKSWAKASADLTPNPVDNILVQAFAFADPVVLPQIEGIDLDGDGK